MILQQKDKLFKGNFSSLFMLLNKKVREKGKIKLNRYFQKFEKGDKVAVVIESSLNFSFPIRLQGRTGEIEDQRGKAYIVKIKDQNLEKRFIIEPVHLKKLKQTNN
ncbi:MAG: 50S ribosomal protein L21e [Candidatus Pacearchaeota archaeon]